MKDSASTGDVTITLPDNLTAGTDYTLKVFAEDVRSSASANLTDYAGNMVDIPLTVAKNDISVVKISDITAPVVGAELDAEAVCATTGVADVTPAVPDSIEVKWKAGTAEVNGEMADVK